MFNIVICIPTYKRPQMLKKLLLSIIENNVNKALIKDINIIVIDNDVDKTAEKISQEVKKEFYEYHKLNYYNYPEKGLANVRNEMFERALEYNPDYIACIDDDEYASSDWINQLILTITSNNGEIAVGPVIKIIESKVSPYISYWFKTPNIDNNKKIEYFRTGNFIINVNFLQESKVKFDCKFNSTGGEDTHFGAKAIKQGANLFWAANAIVYETTPENRANINWLIKRRYTNANNYTYILFLEKKYTKLLKKICVNFIYLVLGLISLVILPFRFKFKYWGILKLAESIGSFAGLVRK